LVQFNILEEFSGGDKKLENEMIELFLKNIPLEIENLRKEILSENIKEIKFVIHKIKNPLEIFGLKRIIENTEQILNLCENKEFKHSLEIFYVMKRDLQIIYNEMDKNIKNF
jgi:HPt (histidine-containing phosphotransfer) domain-containing protein